MKKKVSLLLAIVLRIYPVISSFGYSNMINKIYTEENDEFSESEFVKELEKELKFYFEVLRELRDGIHKIKDFDGLQKQIDKGNDFSKLLFVEATKKFWYSFRECIVKAQSVDLRKFIDSSEKEKIIMKIKTWTWGTVATITEEVVFRAAKKHKDKIAIRLLEKASSIFLAANIAYSAYVCRNEI